MSWRSDICKVMSIFLLHSISRFIDYCYVNVRSFPISEYLCKHYMKIFVIIDFGKHALTVPNNSYHFWAILLHKWLFQGVADIHKYYSVVKDSSADLGVNFKIVQNRPTVKAVCTKISKNVFCIFVNIFVFLRENKEVSFSYFEYLSLNSPKVNQNYYWLWVYFGISVSNCQIRITVLNYTVISNQF